MLWLSWSSQSMQALFLLNWRALWTAHTPVLQNYRRGKFGILMEAPPYREMQDWGWDQVQSLMAIRDKAEVLIQSNYDWLLIVHQFYYFCLSDKHQYFFFPFQTAAWYCVDMWL